MTREAMRDVYRRIRRSTEQLCQPLTVEDQVVQTMPDVSPTKWHLAHTSWFFETFVLQPTLAAYRPLDQRYRFLFNSYYQAVGERHPRTARGLLSRPTVEEVRVYRCAVDEGMERLFAELPSGLWESLAPVVELGLNHEEQHQELMLTDILHVLAANPLAPCYRQPSTGMEREMIVAVLPPPRWVEFAGGLVAVGAADEGFAFDNERPRHRVYLEPFALRDRLVTSGEYLDFILDGGYRRPELWLSDGWDACLAEGWQAPLYWREQEGRWLEMSLLGLRQVDADEPVSHVSYYEADAFARWAGFRLPLEEEWEMVAAGRTIAGNFVERDSLHVESLATSTAASAAVHAEGPPPWQLFGDVWEWTSSAYHAYPGYAPLPGALGEYNGKFMSGRLVLRGGSCATPIRHMRVTYRNFFSPSARWQFSGLRLAR